jgi:hypothetical protein
VWGEGSRYEGRGVVELMVPILHNINVILQDDAAKVTKAVLAVVLA